MNIDYANYLINLKDGIEPELPRDERGLVPPEVAGVVVSTWDGKAVVHGLNILNKWRFILEDGTIIELITNNTKLLSCSCHHTSYCEIWRGHLNSGDILYEA